ncbi:NAD(P)H-dependent glycerol-3-phosphate dehydrogenase [Oharaeibacter diazotrophicus]|uniref:Glycerol-3-phosphate dehydrogenase [NAD(P)+] n=1 Tax=Oharaeibacter diazotrophicus TaxID=1920512 RepID=A0A4R6R8D1_9HYPH|nr:NAD(P)H-dependent glycerol-3-phosphate dehydrogenase [Oharaeibacter diazotrophicus]TDP81837.1 glycerol-3-phosphate dehydrogenase (NAD(P)+) [Oharaeibacter diazotrophicus]BBE73469.1 glycerol-3-phosphate dehydrogenase [NAD(P)+] [Pleomorphomonas sp. SM30]GLS75259.1 glycerol-3-phosphate dehydrogenase [NAD(P)+] [Oharaeibacter diazotrophicus]
MTDRPDLASIAVYGAGAWGSALALVAARAGHPVVLAGRDPAVFAAIRDERRTPRLPGIDLPVNLSAALGPEAVAGADVLLLATPAQVTRPVVRELAPVLGADAVVVSCAKGIEQATGRLISEVIAEAWAGPVGVLSGPGFSDDVARGLPTAVTVAAADLDLAERLARILAGPGFRPYAAGDVVGVQLGGALKNVLAIAAGVVAGRRLGASAEAAVITRGFVEMRRLAAAWGAQADTLMGLSGLGDLVLTCRSTQSRNFALGVALGEGGDPRGFGRLAEGAATAAIAVARAEAFGVDVPIMAAVAAVLSGGLAVDAAVDRLLARPLKREDVL